MRLLFILASTMAFMASCSTIKKASAPKSEQQVKHISSSNSSATKNNSTPNNNSSTKAPVFIDNISFKPGGDQQSANVNSIDPPPMVKESSLEKGPVTDNIISAIEVLPALRFKYAILLNAPVEEVNDVKLLEFIDSWYGTRYRLGGTDKTGIDCSAFVQSFLAAMYGIGVSRTCREQYQESDRITKSRLQEGDLVFFKTRGRSISHVGIYLRNNKFIHASTSSGVMISDLTEAYFAKRYAGAGRFTN